MRKGLLIVVATLLTVMSATGSSIAWTGRSAAMGNVSGLVEDESDLFTHPTAITYGKGLNFYGDFGLTYNDVTRWDYSMAFDTGFYRGYRSKNGSGNETITDTSLGLAFPLGKGRMGVFIQYNGNGISPGRYTGTGYFLPTTGYTYGSSDLKSEFDSVAARIIYALPVTERLKAGGEFGISWRQEKNDLTFSGYNTIFNYQEINRNHPFYETFYTPFPYMLPYDSEYWEADMKASVEAKLGPSRLAFTLVGGVILGGDNKYDWSIYQKSGPFTSANSANLRGSVSGWRIGGETWWRYPLTDTIDIPVVVRATYSEKGRDGSGIERSYPFPTSANSENYTNSEKLFNVEFGGGVDARLSKSARIAAGVYYGYSNNRYDYFYRVMSVSGIDYLPSPSYPQLWENRITLKVAGEVEIAPEISLDAGLNLFYGWVKQDFNGEGGMDRSDIRMDGDTWGTAASVGLSIKSYGVEFEPYLKGGFRKLSTNGNGSFDIYYPVLAADYKKSVWTFGGGLSLKF